MTVQFNPLVYVCVTCGIIIEYEPIQVDVKFPAEVVVDSINHDIEDNSRKDSVFLYQREIRCSLATKSYRALHLLATDLFT